MKQIEHEINLISEGQRQIGQQIELSDFLSNMLHRMESTGEEITAEIKKGEGDKKALFVVTLIASVSVVVGTMFLIS